nr:MAG TPA: hypothetical protein [Caudoviricetes sp.]
MRKFEGLSRGCSLILSDPLPGLFQLCVKHVFMK